VCVCVCVCVDWNKVAQSKVHWAVYSGQDNKPLRSVTGGALFDYLRNF
jgi:hypothetical protein